MKVVIPSKGRAGTIGKHTLSLFPEAFVLVDEREADDYRDVVAEDRLLLHPGEPDVTTLTGIRNWTFDNVELDEDGVLVMADDDVVELKCVVGWSPRKYADPAIALEVLENAAQCAIDAGTGYFGFNQSPNPLQYKPNAPFHLARWVGSVVGFVGDHGLRGDVRIRQHEDVDMSLQALLKHRIIWRDDRWAFVNLRLSNRGGLAEIRSQATSLEAEGILREKWGPYVAFKRQATDYRKRRRGARNAAVKLTGVRVPRKQRHADAVL